MVVFLRVLKEFNLSLDDFWKRQISPAPEFRRRWTRDSRNGRRAPRTLTSDVFALLFR